MTVAASVVATNLIRIASSLVLTRLLSSEAYGVVGIIVAVAVALGLLSDTGMYPFIMRHAEVDQARFRDQMWSLRLARGFVLAALMAAAAVPVSRFMGKPEVAGPIAAYSLFFVIDGLSSLAFVIAVRERKLWRMSLLDLSSSLCQLAVAIPLAIVWANYWAMVIAMLAGAALKSALSYLLFPGSRRRWAVPLARVREMWPVSRYIVPSSMLSFLILQADKLVLARLLPLELFGFYAVATTLAAAPVAAAIPYATRVLFPAYAQAAREGRLGQVFYAYRRKVTLAYMFAVGGLIGAAPLAVEILYDPRYRPVAEILRLLLASTLLSLVNWSSDQALMAGGRTRATLHANLARVGWLGLGGLAGYLLAGAQGLIVAVGTMELGGLAVYWWWLRRERLLHLRQEALGFAAAALGGGLGAGAGALGLRLILG